MKAALVAGVVALTTLVVGVVFCAPGLLASSQPSRLQRYKLTYTPTLRTKRHALALARMLASMKRLR